MKIMRLKEFLNTISFKLFAIILTIVTLLIVLYTYNNYQSRNVLIHQVQNTHENMLRTYLYQIDNQMRDSMAYTMGLALFENDPQLIASSTNEADIQYAKMRVVNDLSEKIISNNLIDAYFVITRNSGDELNFITAYQSTIPSNEEMFRNIC